jgi:hypothetical protein
VEACAPFVVHLGDNAEVIYDVINLFLRYLKVYIMFMFIPVGLVVVGDRMDR